MKGFMFPGQGAQHKGMGLALFDDFKTLTARADQILGYSLRALCEQDPERRLAQTQYTQPALFAVAALACLRELESTPGQPACAMGHSLGEYVALFAAECFDFETGLRLVARRGELMAQVHDGGMCAVIGAGLDAVPALLALHHPEVDVANFNADDQLVVSGPKASMPALSRLLTAKGWRAVPLAVSGAFHSRYMAQAALSFSKTLDTLPIKAPALPVLANVTAQPYPPDAAQVRALLTRQMTGSVRWTDCIRAARRLGVGELKEVGPGRTLTSLLARTS